MYFFYFDESGSRDPSTGTAEKPKDHLYVLLAVGMLRGPVAAIRNRDFRLETRTRRLPETRWQGPLRTGVDCEVKSNWVRVPTEREKRSPFLHALHRDDMARLTDAYFRQVAERKTVIMSSVIDKRYLHDHMTHETLHLKAYEFLLEGIQHYMREYHPKHRALIVMDDTSRQLNRAVAMRHASYQRAGNRNMTFPAIVEYPFFTRSELSNGVQLADLLAYNVDRAFKLGDFGYSYFERALPNFHRRREGEGLGGLKVWPEPSPLAGVAREAWSAYKQKALLAEGE